jgi:acetyl-CoA carboxylase carboxyl transferase subunit beta
VEKQNRINASERSTKEELIECPRCHAMIDADIIRDNFKVCPECEHYYTLSPKSRLRMLADRKSFKELDKGLRAINLLDFPDYEDKLAKARAKSGLDDAILTGIIKIDGIKVAIGVMDTRFLMASMGTVVGEKITRLTEYAQKHNLPLIMVCASGGARMQEGLFSLMQMSKTSAAIKRFKDAGGLYISLLTNPTTGGVSASFAFLGDIILAEPEALICFAGPRVIEQTIGKKLPDGFQKAECWLEHGMVDMIVRRDELKSTISRILKMHK